MAVCDFGHDECVGTETVTSNLVLDVAQAVAEFENNTAKALKSLQSAKVR